MKPSVAIVIRRQRAHGARSGALSTDESCKLPKCQNAKRPSRLQSEGEIAGLGFSKARFHSRRSGIRDIEQRGEAGTHCNTPKRITVTGSLSLEEMARSKAWHPFRSARGFLWALFPREHLTTSPKPWPAPRPHRGLSRDSCRERPTAGRGLCERKAAFECLGSGLGAALYPLREEIKSGQVHRWLDFMRR